MNAYCRLSHELDKQKAWKELFIFKLRANALIDPYRLEAIIKEVDAEIGARKEFRNGQVRDVAGGDGGTGDCCVEDMDTGKKAKDLAD